MIKKDGIINLFIILSLAVFIFGTLIVLLIFTPKKTPELYHGDPLPDFCLEKCRENNYFTSNYNPQFNFIRCECVTEIKFSHSEKMGGADSPKTKSIYFDALSEKEINRSIVIERIKESKEE